MYTAFNPRNIGELVNVIWYSDDDIDPMTGYIAPPCLSPQLIFKIYPSEAEIVLSGPMTQQKQYPYIAEATYLGIEISPTVGSLFEDIQLKELKNGSIQVDKIFGIDLPVLVEHLHSLSSWTEQRNLIEETICRNYPETDRHINHNLLSAMDTIEKTNGTIPIKSLADVVGISKRQLERLFQHHVGLSPKAFCKTVRMQHVLSRLEKNSSFPLALLALDCGYSDQSHLANDFRRTIGVSISTYINK